MHSWTHSNYLKQTIFLACTENRFLLFKNWLSLFYLYVNIQMQIYTFVPKSNFRKQTINQFDI
jgi:hypothetical protein